MISDRLNQLIKYKGISARAFALKIGTSSQVFGKYLEGRAPSFEVTSSIIEVFDDINPDWLLTGRGEMLRPASSPELSREERLLSLIESQQRTIENLSTKK